MNNISPANRVIILVAHGFDEAATAYMIAQMRRLGVAVSLVGLETELVTGQWELKLQTDFGFWDMVTDTPCPLLVLPGPAISVERLFRVPEVKVWVRKVLEGNYVAATIEAEHALEGFTFPDWESHYLPQGTFSLSAFTQMLIDYAWSNAGPHRTRKEEE